MSKEMVTLKNVANDLAAGQQKLLDLVSYSFEAERERNNRERHEERQYLEKLLGLQVGAHGAHRPVGGNESTRAANLVSSLFGGFRGQEPASTPTASSPPGGVSSAPTKRRTSCTKIRPTQQSLSTLSA